MNSEELKKGIKHEAEHSDLFEAVSCGHVKTKQKFYELIARKHLEEIPDYYSRLDALKDPVILPESKYTSKKGVVNAYILVKG